MARGNKARVGLGVAQGAAETPAEELKASENPAEFSKKALGLTSEWKNYNLLGEIKNLRTGVIPSFWFKNPDEHTENALKNLKLKVETDGTVRMNINGNSTGTHPLFPKQEKEITLKEFKEKALRDIAEFVLQEAGADRYYKARPNENPGG